MSNKLTVTIKANFDLDNLSETITCITEALDKLREQGEAQATVLVKKDTTLQL